MRRGLTSIQLALVVCTTALLAIGCTEPVRPPDARLASGYDRLSRLRLFFGHQSVGMNLLDGVKGLDGARGTAFRVVETTDPAALVPGTLAHFFAPENGDPERKLASFEAALDSGIGEVADVALLKFCYVDFGSSTDAAALFAKYQAMVARQRGRHPGLVFVHVTVPLTTVQGGLKGLVKRALGRVPAGVAENAKRQEYSDLVRRAYGGKEPIFDLARFESTDSGRRSGIGFGRGAAGSPAVRRLHGRRRAPQRASAGPPGRRAARGARGGALMEPRPGGGSSWVRRVSSRWKLRRCASVGPGALAYGRVWVHGRGDVHVASGAVLDGRSAPIELKAHLGARIHIGCGALVEGGASIEAQEEVSHRVGGAHRPFREGPRQPLPHAAAGRVRPAAAPGRGDRRGRRHRNGRGSASGRADRARRTRSGRSGGVAACSRRSPVPVRSGPRREGAEVVDGPPRSRHASPDSRCARVAHCRAGGNPARMAAVPPLPKGRSEPRSRLRQGDPEGYHHARGPNQLPRRHGADRAGGSRGRGPQHRVVDGGQLRLLVRSLAFRADWLPLLDRLLRARRRSGVARERPRSPSATTCGSPTAQRSSPGLAWGTVP